MKITFILGVLSLLTGCSGQSPPTYTVIAPNVVRPNADFLVAVTAHGIDNDDTQDVELKIRGRSDAGQTIEIKQATTVQAGKERANRRCMFAVCLLCNLHGPLLMVESL